MTPVVEAGSELTAVLRTIHPVGVDRVGLALRGPDGSILERVPAESDRCSTQSTYDTVSSAPGVESEVTASCVMPEHANNGTWTVTIVAVAGNYVQASTTRTFELVGGTDDSAGPVITVLVGPPATVQRGGSFPLAFRIEDVNLSPDTRTAPANFFHEIGWGGDATRVFACSNHRVTWISPTVVETSMDCPVQADELPGPHHLRLDVADRLGFSTRIEVSVDVV